MQIKIDLKILIFALIFLLTHQLKVYIILMIFAFIHEFGHMFVGILLKFKPTCFEIKPVGFCVSLNNPIDDYNKKILKSNVIEIKRIIIYLFGPVLNLIIAMGLYKFNFFKIDCELRCELIYINLVLFLINILPIYPLDGGRILKSVVCLFCGLKNSYIMIEKVSNCLLIIILFFSSLVVLYFKNVGIVLFVLYLVYIRIVYSKINRRKICNLVTIHRLGY